jgi:hypothetical protein
VTVVCKGLLVVPKPKNRNTEPRSCVQIVGPQVPLRKCLVMMCQVASHSPTGCRCGGRREKKEGSPLWLTDKSPDPVPCTNQDQGSVSRGTAEWAVLVPGQTKPSPEMVQKLEVEQN